MKMIVVSALMLLASLQTMPVRAQESFDTIEGEELDIDGSFTKKPKRTQADRLKDLRAKLEARNEMMVRKKIEDARMKNELALMRKLQKTFDESMKRLDSIQ